MLDFAVNVRHAHPPDWLVQQLAARLPDLASYPSAADVHQAQDAVAERHGRSRDEVLPLAGAAEAFALLSNLRPARAAIIAPAFTEPAAALAAAAVPVHHVVLDPPFGLEGAAVPDDADLVVVGNPTNPTSVLHTREQLLALRRPGRILVVDEAFADSIPGEPQSLAGDPLPDVLVLRSLTKTWALAGLRVGYALGSPEVLARLSAQRAHWPVGTLQLAAIAACCAPQAVAEAAAGAVRLAELRTEMVAGLASVRADVVDGAAPFVLFRMPRRRCVTKKLCMTRELPFAAVIRSSAWMSGTCGPRCAAEWPLLVQAISETTRRGRREAAVSVKLADVIAVLDEAYPPRLAESWDSVGLVCGDPDDALESVTVAVDATPAVVDEVPEASLLLAHHPLLLRGVDTVAASTPKGALVHRLIRTGRSLFTAHTNADSASPGVSDALAAALGLTVEAVLEPRSRPQPTSTSGSSTCRSENAAAVQAAVFEAGAGHIGDYSHCSWSVSGIGQFLPHDGASPAMGSVGAVERVPEDRFEVVAPARARAAVLAAMRAAHPYEEPAFDIFALLPPPSDAGLGRIGTLPRPGTVARLRLPCRRRIAADIVGGARGGRTRHAGVAGRRLRRRGGFAAGNRGRRGRAGLCHG